MAGNDCDPSTINSGNPGNGHCQLSDDECWWHASVTWIAQLRHVRDQLLRLHHGLDRADLP